MIQAMSITAMRLKSTYAFMRRRATDNLHYTPSRKNDTTFNKVAVILDGKGIDPEIFITAQFEMNINVKMVFMPNQLLSVEALQRYHQYIGSRDVNKIVEQQLEYVEKITGGMQCTIIEAMQITPESYYAFFVLYMVSELLSLNSKQEMIQKAQIECQHIPGVREFLQMHGVNI